MTTLKSSLSKSRITFDRLEKLTRDREDWRVVYDKGLAIFEQQHVDLAEAKRVRRHQQRNPPPPTATRQGSARTVCGHVCASAFGLRSHMRRHKGTRWAALSSIGRTTKKERECWVYCLKSQFSQYLKVLWIFSLFSLMNYKTCILKVCPNSKHYSVIFRAWAAFPEGAAAILSWKFRICTEFWYRL